jgi:hypothetical protein
VTQHKIEKGDAGHKFKRSEAKFELAMCLFSAHIA